MTKSLNQRTFTDIHNYYITLSWFSQEPLLFRGMLTSIRARVMVMLSVTTHRCARPTPGTSHTLNHWPDTIIADFNLLA